MILPLGWQMDRTLRYPSQIKVVEHSCSDPKYSARITFRSEDLCVTSEQARTWDRLWLQFYGLVALAGLAYMASIPFQRPHDVG